MNNGFLVFGLVVALAGLPALADDIDRCNPYSDMSCVDQTKEQKLEVDLANGFVKAIGDETTHWYECGQETPKEGWFDRAKTMASNMLEAMKEYDLHVSPWGIWGVIFKESRGNRCAVGPNPRHLAYANEFIEKKDYRMWTEDEVLDVMSHKTWEHSLADLGYGQVVWRAFARIQDQDGTVRVPTASEMISEDAGMRVAVFAMKQRTLYPQDKKTEKRPWLFWPGRNAYFSYEMSIQRIVQRMGKSSKLLFHR